MFECECVCVKTIKGLLFETLCMCVLVLLFLLLFCGYCVLVVAVSLRAFCFCFTGKTNWFLVTFVFVAVAWSATRFSLVTILAVTVVVIVAVEVSCFVVNISKAYFQVVCVVNTSTFCSTFNVYYLGVAALLFIVNKNKLFSAVFSLCVLRMVLL